MGEPVLSPPGRSRGTRGVGGCAAADCRGLWLARRNDPDQRHQRIACDLAQPFRRRRPPDLRRRTRRGDPRRARCGGSAALRRAGCCCRKRSRQNASRATCDANLRSMGEQRNRRASADRGDRPPSCIRQGRLLLVDAAQMPAGADPELPPSSADFIALSSHKRGGPAGIGGAAGARSGDADAVRRPGTRDIGLAPRTCPGALGYAAALDEPEDLAAMMSLRATLDDAISPVGRGGGRLARRTSRHPAIGSYRMPGVASAAQLIRFDSCRHRRFGGQRLRLRQSQSRAMCWQRWGGASSASREVDAGELRAQRRPMPTWRASSPPGGRWHATARRAAA